jgi:predicted O-linked N-acetylglucosamine transferase (SPINDLY family)
LASTATSTRDYKADDLKPGRNDPCCCGSGKKYKKCCQKSAEFSPPVTAQIQPAAPSSTERDQLVKLFNSARYAELESQTLVLLERFPKAGFVWKALGAALWAQGKSALSAMEMSAQLLPNDVEAQSNLAGVCQELGRLEEAESSCRRALQINPHSAPAQNNLGNILHDLGRPEDAIASFRQALALKPDYAEAHSNLLLTLNYQPDMSSEPLLAEARRYGAMVARGVNPYATWPNVPETGRRLRVGLVSGDLVDHPVGYFLDGVLKALSAQFADRLELIAYPGYVRADEVTARIKASCHGWHTTVGLSDEMLARRIREDGIDILVDLAGHTARNRLSVFAWKSAPVQVAWLGYFATTGVAGIDYLIADSLTLPPAEEASFTERIWRLPETRLCFTPPETPVDIAPLPALKNGYITFGCFNNLIKVNDAVIALWARVLSAVPDSRLFFKAKKLNVASVREGIVGRFAALGIDAARLILEEPEPRLDYFKAYHRTDISLDTFPFPGGATSADSLWMGVPVLTLPGDCFLSRQGLGLLMNAGLPEWVASDADDYVVRAVAHCSDLPHLALLRSGLRQRLLASPLCNAPRFARYFEMALRGMWQEWCAGHQQASS